MYSELLTHIQTTDDLHTLKEEISVLQKTFYEQSASFDSVLSTQVRKYIADSISKELNSSGIGNKEYLEGLLKELDKLSTVHLTLSYEPDAQSFASFYQWFVDNVGPAIVLDVYTNPNLLGGAQISFNGKYYDGSLITKINQINRSRKISQQNQQVTHE